jgi:hypothetical protein
VRDVARRRLHPEVPFGRARDRYAAPMRGDVLTVIITGAIFVFCLINLRIKLRDRNRRR